MDMNINAELIRSERLKRAWSQEQLAHVSGLGLRTIQRVETAGSSASLETIKALAAVLERPLTELLVAEAAPAPAPASAPPPTSLPFWRNPRNVFAGATLAGIVFLFASMVAPLVFANQVDIDMAVLLDNQSVSANRLSSENGSAAEVQIDRLLKINLTPTITKTGAPLAVHRRG